MFFFKLLMSNWYVSYHISLLSSKFQVFNKDLTLNLGASLVVQLVKNPPAMQETCIWFFSWEDALEMGMATLSSIQAWTVPWIV